MLKVSDIFKKITVEPIVAKENEGIHSIHRKIVLQKKPYIRSVYVLNAENKVIGMITLKDIMKFIAIRKALPVKKYYSIKTLFTYISKDLNARMIMKPPVIIEADEDIEKALRMLVDHDAEEAAVVNQNGVIVGDLNAYEILREIKV